MGETSPTLSRVFVFRNGNAQIHDRVHVGVKPDRGGGVIFRERMHVQLPKYDAPDPEQLMDHVIVNVLVKKMHRCERKKCSLT